MLHAMEPLQAPEDLTRARENILAGTVGKKESPVVGVPQETIADEEESTESESKRGRQEAKTKKKAVPKKPQYSYRDEKILNWIYETNDMIAREANPQSHVRPVAFGGALAAAKNNAMGATPLADATKAANKSYRNITGVCTIPTEVTLQGNAKGVLMAYCDTADGKMKLFGELTPKPEEYSLIGTPLYVENTYGKRFYMAKEADKPSYVLNSRKNNPNIATFVNTHALDKVIRESIKSGSKNISNTATQYMDAVKASRTTQQTVMVPDAGTATTSNTERPKASDYITILGIQMSADLLDKWVDYAYQDQPWGFMILADTKIYIDLTVEGAQ